MKQYYSETVKLNIIWSPIQAIVIFGAVALNCVQCLCWTIVCLTFQLMLTLKNDWWIDHHYVYDWATTLVVLPLYSSVYCRQCSM